MTDVICKFQFFFPSFSSSFRKKKKTAKNIRKLWLSLEILEIPDSQNVIHSTQEKKKKKRREEKKERFVLEGEEEETNRKILT